MKLYKPIAAILITIVAISSSVYSQDGVGFGASGIYNFQTESFGIGGRAKIPMQGRLSLVPEASYFFAFNPIHEFYGGLSLHYDVLRMGKFTGYLAGTAYYNNWMNAKTDSEGNRKQNNFAPEVGGGIVKSHGCIRPFIEHRYDVKWKEGNLQIGLWFYLRSCKSGGSVGKDNCPANF